MTNLEHVRKFLQDGARDLSEISLQEIRYALSDIIAKARMLRRSHRETANQLQAETPMIFRLKALNWHRWELTCSQMRC